MDAARAEALLTEIENGRYGDGEAIAALARAVQGINRGIAQGEDGDRIRRAIEKLQHAAREVARISGARGFSISAGFPSGIGVSVDWEA